MVAAIKSIAASAGAVCYADPFLPAIGDSVPDGILSRARGWLTIPLARPSSSAPRDRQEPHMAPKESVVTRPKEHLGI
jgi:hypothetical protein